MRFGSRITSQALKSPKRIERGTSQSGSWARLESLFLKTGSNWSLMTTTTIGGTSKTEDLLRWLEMKLAELQSLGWLNTVTRLRGAVSQRDAIGTKVAWGVGRAARSQWGRPSPATDAIAPAQSRRRSFLQKAKEGSRSLRRTAEGRSPKASTDVSICSLRSTVTSTWKNMAARGMAKVEAKIEKIYQIGDKCTCWAQPTFTQSKTQTTRCRRNSSSKNLIESAKRSRADRRWWRWKRTRSCSKMVWAGYRIG